MAQFQWVPWLIGGCGLFYGILKDWLASRKSDSVSVEKRLQALEVSRLVDEAKINGELRLINEKVAQSQGQVSQVQTLLKNILHA